MSAPGDPPAGPDVLAAAEAAVDDAERVLARLDDGTYGTCEVCGVALGDDVLAAAPAARTCAAHR